MDPSLDQIPGYSFGRPHPPFPSHCSSEHLLVHFLLSAIGEKEANFAPQLLADLQKQRRAASGPWEQRLSAGTIPPPRPPCLATPGEYCEGAELLSGSGGSRRAQPDALPPPPHPDPGLARRLEGAIVRQQGRRPGLGAAPPRRREPGPTWCRLSLYSSDGLRPSATIITLFLPKNILQRKRGLREGGAARGCFPRSPGPLMFFPAQT